MKKNERKWVLDWDFKVIRLKCCEQIGFFVGLNHSLCSQFRPTKAFRYDCFFYKKCAQCNILAVVGTRKATNLCHGGPDVRGWGSGTCQWIQPSRTEKVAACKIEEIATLRVTIFASVIFLKRKNTWCDFCKGWYLRFFRFWWLASLQMLWSNSFTFIFMVKHFLIVHLQYQLCVDSERPRQISLDSHARPLRGVVLVFSPIVSERVWVCATFVHSICCRMARIRKYSAKY